MTNEVKRRKREGWVVIRNHPRAAGLCQEGEDLSTSGQGTVTSQGVGQPKEAPDATFRDLAPKPVRLFQAVVGKRETLSTSYGTTASWGSSSLGRRRGPLSCGN